MKFMNFYEIVWKFYEKRTQYEHDIWKRYFIINYDII